LICVDNSLRNFSLCQEKKFAAAKQAQNFAESELQAPEKDFQASKEIHRLPKKSSNSSNLNSNICDGAFQTTRFTRGS
jgi:hypothetical protein